VPVWNSLGARAIRSTLLVDKAYGLFDRLRSRAVLSLASPATLEAYSELAYSAQDTYQSDQPTTELGLFAWEQRALAAFPPAPARVLVGAAGGGREAFALAARGYAVTAFEPSAVLAQSMARRAARDGGVAAYRARYADLPVLQPASPMGSALDTRTAAPFDAGILGWASLSHLTTDAARLETLRWFARLVSGPILVSFFTRQDPGAAAPSSHTAKTAFTMRIGQYTLLGRADLDHLAERAGLVVDLIDLNYLEGWPNAILRPRTPR
jgi:hypothetical protein